MFKLGWISPTTRQAKYLLAIANTVRWYAGTLVRCRNEESSRLKDETILFLGYGPNIDDWDLFEDHVEDDSYREFWEMVKEYDSEDEALTGNVPGRWID